MNTAILIVVVVAVFIQIALLMATLLLLAAAAKYQTDLVALRDRIQEDYYNDPMDDDEGPDPFPLDEDDGPPRRQWTAEDWNRHWPPWGGQG